MVSKLRLKSSKSGLVIIPDLFNRKKGFDNNSFTSSKKEVLIVKIGVTTNHAIGHFYRKRHKVDRYQ